MCKSAARAAAEAAELPGGARSIPKSTPLLFVPGNNTQRVAAAACADALYLSHCRFAPLRSASFASRRCFFSFDVSRRAFNHQISF